MLWEAIAVIMVLFLSASIDTIQLQPSRQWCCWKLLTSIVKCCLLPLFHTDLFSFPGRLATSCLHVLIVSKGSTGAKEKYGLLLKSDVSRQWKKENGSRQLIRIGHQNLSCKSKLIILLDIYVDSTGLKWQNSEICWSFHIYYNTSIVVFTIDSWLCWFLASCNCHQIMWQRSIYIYLYHYIYYYMTWDIHGHRWKLHWCKRDLFLLQVKLRGHFFYRSGI